MSCDKQINATVINMNGVDLQPGGCTKRIACCDIVVTGTYWATPVTDDNGAFEGFAYIDASETKPSNGTDTLAGTTITDSFKVVKLSSGGDTLIVAIADGSTDQVIFDACNQCCGDTPLDITTTIPTQLLEQNACLDSDSGTYKLWVACPVDIGTYGYTMSATKRGTDGLPVATAGCAGTSTAASSAHASTTALAAAIDAEYDSGGTVAHVGASTTFCTRVAATSPGVNDSLLFESTSPFSVGIVITTA